MTTYRIQGFRVEAGTDGEDFSVEPANMEIFTSPTDGQLQFYYLSPNANRTTVRLADYNLTLDKVHMNDLPTDVSLDISDVSWKANGAGNHSRLFSLHYEEDGVDFFFGMGPDKLPEIESANSLRNFLIDSQSAKLDVDSHGGKIQLSTIPDVEIKGVYIPDVEAPLTMSIVAEAFEFDFSKTADDDPSVESDFEFIPDEQTTPGQEADAEQDFEFVDLPEDVETFTPDHSIDGF